jgi:hypothetical protein
MMDNKRVNENHQKGIERVIQKKGDLMKGQGGKMHNEPSEKARWRRESSTPKSA